MRLRTFTEAFSWIILLVGSACAQTAPEVPASKNEEKAFYAFAAIDFSYRCSDLLHTPRVTEAAVRKDKLKLGDQMITAKLSTPFRLIILQRSASEQITNLPESDFTAKTCNDAMVTVRNIEAFHG